MEFIIILLVLASAVSNIYVVKKVSTVVNVTVPVPEVHVNIEVPPSVELQAIETVQYDYTYLEAILQQLVDLQKTQQLPYVIPNSIPNPIPISPYPNYPLITYGDTKTGNEIEVDGVKGKQFPAR